MKSVNDFVRKDWAWPDTLDEQIEYYKEINKRLEDCLSQKKAYDDLLSDENTSKDESGLSFKERLSLYNIINNLIARGLNYSDVDLFELRRRIESVYPDIRDYLRIKREISSLRDSKRDVLTEAITFDIFYKEHYDERCFDRHFFVRLDDELKCMCCGATTKEYPLTKEQLDFLTLCANSKGILLEEATKEDLHLLQVLIEKQDYYRSLRKTVDPFDDDNDDYLADAEEEWLSEQAEIPELCRQIRKAHLLDSKIYDSEDIKVSNPKYLSDDKAKELLLEVEKELDKARKIDSRFKDLIIEECKTARYEILILSGQHIPSLLEQANDEEDRIALTKAYYNISNSEYRVNSNYFNSNDNDAYFYDCFTANEEINNRILQMKLRR